MRAKLAFVQTFPSVDVSMNFETALQVAAQDYQNLHDRLQRMGERYMELKHEVWGDAA